MHPALQLLADQGLLVAYFPEEGLVGFAVRLGRIGVESRLMRALQCGFILFEDHQVYPGSLPKPVHGSEVL